MPTLRTEVTMGTCTEGRIHDPPRLADRAELPACARPADRAVRCGTHRHGQSSPDALQGAARSRGRMSRRTDRSTHTAGLSERSRNLAT